MQSVLAAGHTLGASGDHRWPGLTLREQLLPPMQTGEQPMPAHLLMLNLGRPGLGQFRSGCDKWTDRFYHTGSVSLVPQGHVNDARWNVEAHVIYATLDPALLRTLLEADGLVLHEARGVADATMGHLLRRLHQAGHPDDYASRLDGEALLLALAAHLATTYAHPAPRLPALRGRLSAAQLLRVSEYCRAQADQPLGLADLARQVHLSVFHFARLFKRTLGVSPHQYLLHLKIERAQEYLRHRRYSPIEIADLLGFADGAHFARVFRKVSGCSPSQFGQR